MTEPIVITVRRHKCPHCARSCAKKAHTVAHIGRCWANPAARGCKTCEHFRQGPEGEGCAEGVSLAGSAMCDRCNGVGEIGSGDASTCCPECGGDGGVDGPTRKSGPIVHCDLWEAQP
jgi:hypothetical protein